MKSPPANHGGDCCACRRERDKLLAALKRLRRCVVQFEDDPALDAAKLQADKTISWVENA